MHLYNICTIFVQYLYNDFIPLSDSLASRLCLSQARRALAGKFNAAAAALWHPDGPLQPRVDTWWDFINECMRLEHPLIRGTGDRSVKQFNNYSIITVTFPETGSKHVRNG